jgi:hypothetical protein
MARIFGTPIILPADPGSSMQAATKQYVDNHTATGTAGGALNGTYPNPNLDVAPWAPITLTDAATVAVDASLGNHFRCSLTASRTIGAPSNATDGQRILFELTASGGSWTPTFTTGSSGSYIFGSDITAVTAIATGKTDFIGAVYNSTAARWRIIAYVKGF